MVCSGHFWFFLVIINLTRPPPSQFCQHCCFTTIAINRHAPWMPGGHHQETSQASTSRHRATDQSWLDAQGHPTPHLPKKKSTPRADRLPKMLILPGKSYLHEGCWSKQKLCSVGFVQLWDKNTIQLKTVTKYFPGAAVGFCSPQATANTQAMLYQQDPLLGFQSAYKLVLKPQFPSKPDGENPPKTENSHTCPGNTHLDLW